VHSSQARCPFCPEKIFEMTPKFPAEVCKDGRFVKGECVFFPNLSPFGQGHAVGVMTKAHFTDLDQYSPLQIEDTLLTAQAYLLAQHKAHPAFRWPVLVWNFLPPSAGSIIHPHMQILVEDEPVPEQRLRLARSAQYHAATKKNFFHDFIHAEKKLGERYLGGNESVQVFVSFAAHFLNEVLFVFPHNTSLSTLTPAQVKDFADVLLRALKAYKSIGVGSFNLASLSGPVMSSEEEALKEAPGYCLHVKLFSRPNPRGVYTNDTGPMERIYGTMVVDSVPEAVAQLLKPFFA